MIYVHVGLRRVLVGGPSGFRLACFSPRAVFLGVAIEPEAVQER